MATRAISLQRGNGQSAATKEARAAGLSGGTGFAGIVLLMQDGTLKSILIILAPAITVIIGSSWHLLANEINTRVADWRIKTQRKRVEALLKTLEEGSDLKQQAQKDLDALRLLEVEISKKRVQAIVAS